MSERVVPEGWKLTTIREITKTDSLFSDGDWVESKDQDPLGENRLIQLADIGDGRFINKSARFMNDEQFNRLKCTALEEDDVIIARMPEPLGRACVFPKTDQKCATVVDVAVIRTRNANQYWLMSIINSAEFRRQIKLNASGTTRTRIARGALANIKLGLPPLPEQNKIASILTSVDDVIEKTRSQISKLQDLKQATMNELLTRGIGHTEFKDSSVGRLPKDMSERVFPDGWGVKKLGEVGYAKGGKRLPKGGNFSPVVTDYPYIRVTDFENGTVCRDELRYVNDEVRLSIKRYTISSNDLYISIAGSIGIIGVVPIDLDGSLLTENAAKIVINTDIIWRDYLKYYLNSESSQSQFNQEKGTGGGVPKLALFRIEETTVLLPPYEEQQKIASILSSIDAHIEKKQGKLEQIKSLKKSLMQDLFTGRVRITVN